MNNEPKQLDFILCDVTESAIKDIVPQLEHPFFSLSKHPDTEIRKYHYSNSWIEITPSAKGSATIYDKDVLVYVVSQLIAKLNEGFTISRKVKINSYALLKKIGRGTSGWGYNSLIESITRLEGTRIRTNIITGDEQTLESFGLIDHSRIKRKNEHEGPIIDLEITISKWLYDAVIRQSVLTLSPGYFLISKPTHKRIYELARKHCGQQFSWRVGLKTLYGKSGVRAIYRLFKSRFIKQLVRDNDLPDYRIVYDFHNEMVTFYNRDKWWTTDGDKPDILERTYLDLKERYPRYDVFELEEEWLTYWRHKGSPKLTSPDKAFIGFVEKARGEGVQ